MQNWRNAFSVLLLAIGLMAVLQSFAPAKIERNKVIKKDYDAKAEVQVSHQYGPLTIKKSSDGRIHLEAEMLLEGRDDKDIEAVLERFDVEVQESGDQLLVRTRLNIESCNTVNDNMTIKFTNGQKVKGLSQMLVKMTLYVADPERMSLSNKYDRIELTDDFNGDLKVDLYSGELLAGSLGGRFQLDMKYGKARLGSVGRAKWVVYDSEVLAGPIQEAEVSSKYSEYVLGAVAGNLRLETYDDNWQVGDIAGKLTLNDKYSEFSLNNVGAADVVVFDGKLAARRVGELNLRDTKYTQYSLDEVGKLDITSVFDDDIKVIAAGQVTASDSKYTEYRVGKLKKQFYLSQSFDDNIRLDEVAADFNMVSVDGKYTELDIHIAEGANYQVSADMKYGDFDYPQNRLTVRVEREKNSSYELSAYGGTETTGEQASRLTVKGFDMNVKLR